MAKASPFDFSKAVGESQADLVAEGKLDINDWSGFMICRALGHRMDAMDAVSMVNERPNLSKRAQYTILRATVRRRSTRKEEYWAKSPKIENLATVKEHFGVGDQRGLEILDAIGQAGVNKILAMSGGAEKRMRNK